MTTSELAPEPAENTARTAPAPPTSNLRPLALRLHFYAGIFVAPFILLAAISGGLYAIAPTIESFTARDLLRVSPSGPDKPIDEQVRAAQAARPDLMLAAVSPAPGPGDTTRVIFNDPRLGESERYAIFVDPSTARPVGGAVVYGSSGALPLRTWISKLHKDLHLGKPGAIYSELAASWVGIIALAGSYLWIRRYVTRRPANRLLTPGRSAKGRLRTLNWHGAVGLWILLPLLLLSATGLTWSTYAGARITDIRAALDWQTPTVNAGLPGAAPSKPAGEHDHGHAAHSSPDAMSASVNQLSKVVATARANDVGGAIEVSLPGGPDKAFTVKQLRTAWTFSSDAIAVDGASGVMTDRLAFADWPLMAKLTNWTIGLHMGLLLGLPNQLVLLAVAIGLGAVIARGYLLWWQRRPVRGPARIGKAPKRGAWRSAPPAAVAALALIAVATAWLAPLVGISVLAFLVIDLAIAARERLRPT